MGNCCTQENATASPTTDIEDEEEDILSKSLAAPGNGITSPKARFARKTSAHKGVMSSIAMQFPHIRRSYQTVKQVFEKYATDENKSYVTKDKVAEILVELGARKESLTEANVKQIIKTANLNGDEHIDFKEFLIAAAVGCFLKADPTAENTYFLRIRKGFEAAQLAFGKIDKDGSGQIDFDELKSAFLAMKEDDLIMERLKELDFNGDKSIEFPEFVWGLSAWVGMDEDETNENYDFDDETQSLIVKTKQVEA
eukprot:501022_1